MLGRILVTSALAGPAEPPPWSPGPLPFAAESVQAETDDAVLLTRLEAGAALMVAGGLGMATGVALGVLTGVLALDRRGPHPFSGVFPIVAGTSTGVGAAAFAGGALLWRSGRPSVAVLQRDAPAGAPPTGDFRFYPSHRGSSGKKSHSEQSGSLGSNTFSPLSHCALPPSPDSQQSAKACAVVSPSV